MKPSNNNTIEINRHSLAHVMASAIQRLYPEADVKFGIGPVIEHGFFYDFQNAPLSEEAFPAIEEEMRSIIADDIPFKREEMPLQEAITFFEEHDQPLKVELLQDLLERGTTNVADDKTEQGLPDVETVTNNTLVSLYHTGSFVDLCRGPHVASTGELNPDAFKLMRVAGAYWRGDENNPQMQRVYGTAFKTTEELEEHLTMLKEAKRRDHRTLGKDLDLFLFSDLVGSGLPLWTPNGTVLRNLLDNFVWQLRRERGYQKVEIPHLTKKDLYKTSGHWEKFGDDLFRIETREGHLFAIKPMNCPHHAQIYKRRMWSYRDLPQRYANTTMVYRDEQSGELAGLSRVRSITQDDAHVFCREDDVKQEAFAIWDIVETFYDTFGFDVSIRLSTHDPNNMHRFLGEISTWESAVAAFRTWLEERGAEYTEAPGEAAFYGPKIDFIANDSLGRAWQIATIQIDRNLPERFDLTCINEQGDAERIVMLHAAIMGSIERFISVLIEHFAGAFPTWLSPMQVRILPISKTHGDYARVVHAALDNAGIRVVIDDADETIGNRIRKAEEGKIPYTLIVGNNEQEANGVAVRIRGEGDVGMVDLERFTNHIAEDINTKALTPSAP